MKGKEWPAIFACKRWANATRVDASLHVLLPVLLPVLLLTSHSWRIHLYLDSILRLQSVWFFLFWVNADFLWDSHWVSCSASLESGSYSRRWIIDANSHFESWIESNCHSLCCHVCMSVMKQNMRWMKWDEWNEREIKRTWTDKTLPSLSQRSASNAIIAITHRRRQVNNLSCGRFSLIKSPQEEGVIYSWGYSWGLIGEAMLVIDDMMPWLNPLAKRRRHL